MQGFTTVNTRRRLARKARENAEQTRLASESLIPGAVWANIPLSRSHLPGIPYSYYDDEIVMLRERTAALIERQNAEAWARAHTRGRRVGDANPNEWHEMGKSGKVLEKRRRKAVAWIGSAE
jgi:hypothetical protein